jgi:methionyl-tRNA synthetase
MRSPLEPSGRLAFIWDLSMPRRILITSALPYINGVKHLGNLAGSMLPADLYARYQRAQGSEVLYICATDEHGTPAELAAQAAGQDVRAYCDEQHELQKSIGAAFGLSWDWFGRSSSAENRELTQHFAAVLEAKGLIEERTDRMVYSIDDGRFLPDRYVEGTCPKCGYEKARGDQCDNCGSLLDPVDLINPYSAVSGSRNLEVRDTNHLYLLQSKLQERIRAFIDSREGWPSLTRSIAYKHLDEGLIDRGITRDLAWGVPVAKDGVSRPGFENKVFYVWFDAPIEYIAATAEWAKATGGDWRRWWRTDAGADDVRYVEFMGKDNVAFHTVSFPATILGSDEPWKLVDMLKSFNWLNWMPRQCSKHIQNMCLALQTSFHLIGTITHTILSNWPWNVPFAAQTRCHWPSVGLHHQFWNIPNSLNFNNFTSRKTIKFMKAHMSQMTCWRYI